MRNTVLLAAIFLLTHASAQKRTLESFLNNVPGLYYKKISVPDGFKTAYEIFIEQPLDHKNPERGSFLQKLYLSHRDFTLPVVFVTEGYDCPSNYIGEVTLLLNANQLQAEHRYFGKSIPDTMNYSFLNLEQATADLHRINHIFKELYSGNWVSTGISKGGQTTLYYRYFYPEDVTVSIPYVAPFNLSVEDKRIYTFLDTVGSAECRDNIKKFQRLVLQKRDSILPIMQNYSYETGYEFTFLTLEKAFEYSVLEYPFSFWQWGYDCSLIPEEGSSVEQIIVHLLTVSDIGFFSDGEMEKFSSHYYQAATEMGYYGYRAACFDTLIKTFSEEKNPLATFPPNMMDAEYDSTLALNALAWLKSYGNNIVYIYGTVDTWSATAIQPSGETNSVWFFLNSRNHGDARIRNMLPDELKFLAETLGHWLNMEVDTSLLQKRNKQLQLD
ncbi:MAG: hypothetical protein JXB34_00100 [Bacteroidales bacterium]|nr:hypothetical protein [Bacteroidales bacterium]